MNDEKRRPLKTFSGYGCGVSVAVWAGDKGPTATVKKRYKPKDESEYKDTGTYFVGDVLALSQLCAQAAAYMNAEQQRQWQEQRSNGRGYSAPEDIPQTPATEVIDFEDEDIPF